jgi:hypothetical protein
MESIDIRRLRLPLDTPSVSPATEFLLMLKNRLIGRVLRTKSPGASS